MIKKTFHYPKKNRLCLREDFQYLQRDSARYSAPSCLIYYRASRINIPETRIAFSISKKMGNAVKRNRLKRILKEYFRCSEFNTLGLDCLMVVNFKQKKFYTENPKEFEKWLIRDFGRGLQKIAESSSVSLAVKHNNHKVINL